MLWFLVLHIIALLFWCAALLYLPALVAADHRSQSNLSSPGRSSMARFIFTNIASPAALIAIMAGTIVFLLNHATELWLVIKLSLVTGLVVAHTLTGLLLLRVENQPEKPVLLWCGLLEITFLTFMAAIIWTVLAKPDSGVLP